jgi:DHA1 family bicyclomycin/chloramphenicol resistance-like MFS transporter
MEDKLKLDRTFWCLIYVTVLCNLINDIFIPMLHEMAVGMHTNINMIQTTISIEFFGYALGSLVTGIYQNRLSMNKMMYCGIVLLIVSSLACGLSSNIWLFIISRVIQGFGDGITVTLFGILYVRSYKGVALVKVDSIMGMGIAIVPLIAPVLGAYIGVTFSWRAIFYLITLSFVLVFFIAYNFRKKLVNKSIEKVNFKEIIRSYIKPLANKKFTILTFISGFTIGSLLICVTLTPHYFQVTQGFDSVKISYMLALIALALLLSSGFNLLLVKRTGSMPLIMFGIIISIIFAALLTFVDLDKWLSGYYLVIPIALFLFGQYLILCNASGYSMSFIYDDKERDNAVCIQSFIELLIASITGMVASAFTVTSLDVIGSVFLAVAVVILFLSFGLFKKQKTITS